MASSGNPSSSAVQATPPNTDVFAPAGTSATARWRCAETVYNAGQVEDRHKRIRRRLAGGKGTHRPEPVQSCDKLPDGAERQLPPQNSKCKMKRNRHALI